MDDESIKSYVAKMEPELNDNPLPSSSRLSWSSFVSIGSCSCSETSSRFSDVVTGSPRHTPFPHRVQTRVDSFPELPAPNASPDLNDLERDVCKEAIKQEERIKNEIEIKKIFDGFQVPKTPMNPRRLKPKNLDSDFSKVVKEEENSEPAEKKPRDKKSYALQKEARRRQRINKSLDELRTLVPSLSETSPETLVYQETARYVHELAIKATDEQRRRFVFMNM